MNSRCVTFSIDKPTFCDKPASIFGPRFKQASRPHKFSARHQRKNIDLIVIGSRRKDTGGHFWRSHLTYEIIKAVEPPVLVAIGACERISRILLCSGGKHYIDPAVRLTGTLATAIHAEVTVFHIMAEPPAIYAHLLELEDDVDALLRSDSVLGRNLRVEKKTLEKLGVTVKIRIRHGFIVDNFWRKCRRAVTI